MTLKEIRISAGKTIKETADALNVAVSSCYNYEQGIRQIDIKQVLILAELFDCSEKEIIESAINSRIDR